MESLGFSTDEAELSRANGNSLQLVLVCQHPANGKSLAGQQGKKLATGRLRGWHCMGLRTSTLPQEYYRSTNVGIVQCAEWGSLSGER